jgi:starch-binding outer membrane protein, SusD/RagB family
MLQIHKKISLSTLYLSMIIGFGSCTKFIEVDPPITGINADNVYTTDATAAAVLTGIYTNLSKENFSSRLSIIPALTADELVLFDLNNTDYYPCYVNSLSAQLPSVQFWNKLYAVIFSANNAIDGLNKATSLTTAVKKQLSGEARFLRAFMYFYLVNYYGDVPLALTTDYKTNSTLERTSTSVIYSQIIQDLTEAIDLLSENFVDADGMSTSSFTERVRPNKWAAHALLSRVYLYTNDFEHAEEEANIVISHSDLFNLTALNNAFLKNSTEAIWQLQVVGTGFGANTEEGRTFVLPNEGPSGFYPLYLSNTLVNSFDTRDQRRINWIDSVTVGTEKFFFANKYKIGSGISESTEYPMVLRIGEQYAIRGEARIKQGNIADGIADLNQLRKRANNGTAPLNNQLPLLPLNLFPDDAIIAVENERRFEFFMEWGHRWFDLIRTERADTVFGEMKGNNWQATDKLFPIPQDDIQKNPGLRGHQNDGY